MSKRSDSNVNGPFNQRDILMVLVAWMFSVLAATGTALPLGVQVASSYGTGAGLLVGAADFLPTGILWFLGMLALLQRFRI